MDYTKSSLASIWVLHDTSRIVTHRAMTGLAGDFDIVAVQPRPDQDWAQGASGRKFTFVRLGFGPAPVTYGC